MTSRMKGLQACTMRSLCGCATRSTGVNSDSYVHSTLNSKNRLKSRTRNWRAQVQSSSKKREGGLVGRAAACFTGRPDMEGLFPPLSLIYKNATPAWRVVYDLRVIKPIILILCRKYRRRRHASFIQVCAILAQYQRTEITYPQDHVGWRILWM